MKKLLGFLMGALLLIEVGVTTAYGTTLVVVDGEDYDFEYLITEIRPSVIGGTGMFYVRNYSSEYPDNKIILQAYRLDEAEDPYSLGAPPRTGIRYIYEAAQMPAYSGVNLPTNVIRDGLDMGEGVDMEFYYSVRVAVDYGEGYVSYKWIGARKVSYAHCAEAAEYQVGVICKLSGQDENGVLQYDEVWVGGRKIEVENEPKNLGEGGDEEGNESDMIDDAEGDEGEGDEGESDEGESDEEGERGMFGGEEEVVEEYDDAGEVGLSAKRVVSSLGGGGIVDPWSGGDGGLGDLLSVANKGDETVDIENPPVGEVENGVKVEWLWVFWLVVPVALLWLFMIVWRRQRGKENERTTAKMVADVVDGKK